MGKTDTLINEADLFGKNVIAFLAKAEDSLRHLNTRREFDKNKEKQGMTFLQG